MIEKKRWPHAEAWAVACELCADLAAEASRFLICGSLRREKPLVGDIEIVFVPRTGPMRSSEDLFETVREVSLVDLFLGRLLAEGVIERRRNVNGSAMWGDSNKLATHLASGIPVDFFATTEDAWWNYVVCRTGGAESNKRIASEAKARGWKWAMTGPGFVRRTGPDRGRIIPMRSEREVFEFVKLPYLPAAERP
jgi:DNA polymerase/3'-5' exonuclease PolX